MEEDFFLQAVSDFKARVSEEVHLHNGDIVKLVPGVQPQRGFSFVVNSRTLKYGWAPTTFLHRRKGVPRQNSYGMAIHSYYRNIGRKSSEVILLRPYVKPGSYLLRPCSTGTDHVVLSVRRGDEVVHHYKIRLDKTESSCYLLANVAQPRFPKISSLIQYYSNPGTGKFIALGDPIDKVMLEPDNIYEMNIVSKEIRLRDRLGQGQFGEVWKARWRGLDVAVKQCKHTSDLEKTYESREMLLNESVFLCSLDHPNIMTMIGISNGDQGEQLWMVTELMNNGSLRDVLQSKEGRSVIKLYPHMIDIMIQIADGMRYLTEVKMICHRDLRAANVLLDSESNSKSLSKSKRFTAKIADFGLARLMGEDSNNSLGYGSGSENSSSRDSNRSKFPYKWTAPEAAHYNKFTAKSDVWSFGVVIYEILSFGTMPYRGRKAREVFDFIEKGGRISRDECCATEDAISIGAPPTKCPEKLYGVIMSCWHIEPESRPTFSVLHTQLSLLEVDPV